MTAACWKPWQGGLWRFSIPSVPPMMRPRELFEQGAPHGAAALADQQTAGRGRMGRPFVSPSGTGIYVSVLLTAPAALENAHLVTPAAASGDCGDSGALYPGGDRHQMGQ